MSRLQGKDAQNIVKDKRGFTDREINWFWYHNQHFRHNPYVQYSSMLEKRQIVHAYFDLEKDGDYFLKSSLINKDKFLVNESYFSWIDKHDDRLLIFIINTIIKMNLTTPPIVKTINNYEYFLNLIDNLNINKDLKISQLIEARSTWSSHKSKSKDTEWIKYNDSKQIEWAWEYIKKGGYQPFFPTPPISEHQKYLYTLSTIDLIGHINNTEAKELFLIKMKKTWSQKKYRDEGKIKKPYHIPLTKVRHEELKKMSELFEKSIPDVLDFIIDKTYNECMRDNEDKLKEY